VEISGRVSGGNLVTSGLGRGIVAAMAMSAVRQVTISFGLVQQTPPDAVLKQRGLGVLVRAPRLAYFVARRQVGLVELAHWGYGAMGGAAFSLLPSSIVGKRWVGPGYGALTWLVFELSVAPILGLAQARRVRPVERLAFLGDHLLYGWLLAGNREWAMPPRRRRLFAGMTTVRPSRSPLAAAARRIRP
jgi:uncharacterized membrane protein YagU involved in acid resistance